MGAYKTEPVLKDYLWGGHKLEKMFGRDNGGKKVSESWEISVHKDGESTCGGEKLSSIIARTENFIDKRNSPLPVLIKYIDAAQNLSVQVHPDDAYAREREGDNGKTEMWYILSAEEGAGIYCGFSRNITREEFRMKVREGTVEDCLNFIPVRAGDCYLIEAGTVHAIGAGALSARSSKTATSPIGCTIITAAARTETYANCTWKRRSTSSISAPLPTARARRRLGTLRAAECGC